MPLAAIIFLVVEFLAVIFVALAITAWIRKAPERYRRTWWALGTIGVAVATLGGLYLIEGEINRVSSVAAVLLALAAVGWCAWTLLVLGRSRGRRRCPKCWYDMIGTEGLRCPECGRTAKREKHLFRTRRHARLSLLSLIPSLLAIYLALLPSVQQHGWPAALPTTALVWCLELDNNDWAFEELARRTTSPMSPGVGMPFPNERFFDWQWSMIGRRCLEIVASDAPMQKRYAMISWLDIASYRLDGEPMAERIDAALVRLLNDPAPQIRGRAAMSVASGNDPAASIESMLPVLRDEDPRARRGAVMGLRILLLDGSGDVFTLLSTALDDPDGSVRSAALGAFCSASLIDCALPAEVVARIREMANDVDPSVRGQQVSCMARLLDDGAARAELLAAFRSGDSARRGGAIWTLSMDDRFEQAEFVEELIAALTDADPMVRGEAASALGYVEFAELEPFEEQLKSAFDPTLYPETASLLRQRLAEFHQRDVTRELDALESSARE